MSFVKLLPQQIQEKANFIKNYVASNNAADGSLFDANSNVENKNVATLMSEINKDIIIQVNRHLIQEQIKHTFNDNKLATTYLRDIEDHVIYTHDESSIFPYCASISMYPMLLNGLKDIGGSSEPPKHLSSFAGIFENLMYLVSAQFAGAVATVEFLMYFNHFAKKDYGEDYINTHTNIIDQTLQHIVYVMNQPSAARGSQSVFWNISILDKYYFESLFGENFSFPDGTKADWDGTNKLQRYFMIWFNKERSKTLLTFPVITSANLVAEDKNGFKDKENEEFIAEQLSNGNSFFIYSSDSVDALSSCCRLRNSIESNEFSYTLGAGGISTGSLNVITLNINRIIQENRNLKSVLDRVHKYQVAFRKFYEKLLKSKMLPIYDAGYITMDKQFLTIGINGLTEAAEGLGLTVSNNQDYKDWISNILKTISDSNKNATKKYGLKFNTELVPAENLGIKNAKWDKESGLFSPRECYNSYFYPVELDDSDDLTIVDKFELYGKEIMEHLDGGAALHLNMNDYPDKEQYKKLFEISAKTGCNFFTTNIKVTMCNDKNCGYIDKRTLKTCSKCGCDEVTHATRIIGFLRPISSFSAGRRAEESHRFYHKE